MSAATEKHKSDANSNFSFRSITRANIVLCVMFLFFAFMAECYVAHTRVQEQVTLTSEAGRMQIVSKVDETLSLMTFLASQPAIYNPDVPSGEKMLYLNSLSKAMGYLGLHYIDSDKNLISRDTAGQIQKLPIHEISNLKRIFTDGVPVITDSLVSSLAGNMLCYVFAVPTYYRGEVTGGLAVALRFRDFEELLRVSVVGIDIQARLLGRQGQVMSTNTGRDGYGEEIRNNGGLLHLLGSSDDEVCARLKNHEEVKIWSWRNGTLNWTRFVGVESTPWYVAYRGNYFATLRDVFVRAIPLMMVFILCGMCAVWLINRKFRVQQKAIQDMVRSVRELEKNLRGNNSLEESRESMDFSHVLQITNKGMSDGLTGIVTRSVFMLKLKDYLRALNPQKTFALCFVDLDDLKRINDTNGHAVGDRALKETAYILREFERKYDGLVGRYGGDEFIIVLGNIDSEKDLTAILDELVLRLHCEVVDGDLIISIHCSVGVAIGHKDVEVSELFEHADEALYAVKKDGKGYYRIYGKH